MKILITGGAGYIGTACGRRLLDEGHEVVVLDNLSRGQKEKVDDRAIFVEGDVMSRDDLQQLCDQHGSFDGILHMAAKKSVPEGEDDPHGYFHSNIQGTLNVLETMKQNDIDTIFFSSSAAVYQPNESGIYSEQDICEPQTVYGATKYLCEELIRQYQRLGHVQQAVIFRYFNLAGDDGLLFRDDEAQNVFPLLAQASAGIKDFAIFGDDYDTRDGTGVRDYIHLSDLVEAHLLGLNKKVSGVFNLGTSEGTTVKELVEKFDEISGQSMNAKTHPRRAGDVAVALADASKAQHELDWQPTKTLDEMITSTLEVYQ